MVYGRQVLLWDNHWLVVVEGRSVIRLTRSEVPFDSVDSACASFAKVHAAMEGLDRSSYALLLDLRQGPSRNDPGFEAATRPIRTKIKAGFWRIAMLVGTAAGELQVRRLTMQERTRAQVFDSERFALEYVRELPPALRRAGSSRPPPRHVSF